VSFSFVTSYLALWALVLFHALVVLALLRQLSELRRLAQASVATLSSDSEEQLSPGTAAPQFRGFDALSKAPVSLDSAKDRGAALVFLSSECGTCRELANDFHRLTRGAIQKLVVLYCLGDAQRCASMAANLKLPSDFVTADADAVAASFGVSFFPQ
jgi:hypothetical protein